MSSIIARARQEIRKLEPYSSARYLIKGKPGMAFLDANECPHEPMPGGIGYSRYPDQQPAEVIEALCRVYDLSSCNLLAVRGADEAIDLTVRAFCEPGRDNVIICPPTFPMYAHSAAVQGCEVREIPLDSDFQLDPAGIKKSADENTKIIFLCSPNNPTANLMRAEDIEGLCEAMDGRALIAVDETYNLFSGESSTTGKIGKYPNLIVFRTLSKEYACAGLRCGLAAAQSDIIDLLAKILPPYPLPVPVAQAVGNTLDKNNLTRLAEKRSAIIETRENFVAELKNVEGVEKIYPSDANFVLVRFRDAGEITRLALENNIVLRDQSHQCGLDNCIRITIGAQHEMEKLLGILRGESIESPVNIRTAKASRVTCETAIDVRVNLDESAPVKIDSGVAFFDHMLEQVARHGGFSLELNCKGDLEVDAHHTIEDCGIALGQALREALGSKEGLGRYGFVMPMDESLAQIAIDLSGRFYLGFEGEFPDRQAGDMPAEMIEHFFYSLCENLPATCHISVKGENTHHMAEACFKGFGRAMRQAVRREGEELPSTKGVL